MVVSSRFAQQSRYGGAACGAAYTASKHALLGLSRSTAWMYAKNAVTCNSVLLGPTGESMLSKSTGSEIDRSVSDVSYTESVYLVF